MARVLTWTVLCAVLWAGVARAAGPTPDLGPLASSAAQGGFATVAAPHRFEFPADHGPHPDFRQEWWYFTGNLEGPQGERFGFELTFFRFALAPEPPAGSAATPVPTAASAWRTRQLYMAHFAVTDVARGRFVATQKLSRGALGLAGATPGTLDVRIDDWQAGAPPGAPWVLRAHGPQYGIELDARPLVAPVLNGEAGLSRKSGETGSASYYYSIPRVAVSGRLTRGDVTLPVKGCAWLDREWGSGTLGAAQEGWDWFALQFDDGAALMFYALRLKDGGRDRYSAGTWIDADGRALPLSATELAITPQSTWTSPRGGRYPARWRLQLPAQALDVEVRPVLADQELDTRPRYWEGAVDVSGERGGRPARGRGYVELVGYAR